MADEPNDYYDIIREKITDPEIQKALDAFHARGVAEQRQAREDPSDAAQRPEGAVLPAGDGIRRSAPEDARPPEGTAAPRTASGTPRGSVPPGGPAKRQTPPDGVRRNGLHASEERDPQTRDPSVFRQYMQRTARPPVYPDASAEDAYEAAYRDAMRKASGERAASARGRAPFAVGVLVILFAVFGLGCAVFFGIKGASVYRDKKNEARRAAYNARLICVAAVDPDAFDDISAASMPDLIKIAVWSLIGSGVDPNRYAYANGELCLPQADVEAAYAACFGTQLPIVHQTAEGYGYTVQYSEEDGAYYIPMTTLEPLYTPRVVSVETKSGATVVTCGMIGSGMWKQDRVTGDVAAPEPDKYIRVTFRTASGAEYISSLQSLGLPETAIPSAAPSTDVDAETEATAPAAETTTEKQIVITWD